MAHFVLSDDLTGASGVASMVDGSLAATVNLSRFDPHLAEKFPFIAINLDARESSESEAAGLIEDALARIGDSWTALRIDSALRGPVSGLVAQLSSRGRILVTDTIPEYGRRTDHGKTIIGAREKDLSAAIGPAVGAGKTDRVVIADSRSHTDLQALASRCFSEALIPVDPGPLVSLVARQRLLISGETLRTLTRASQTPIEKVAFVIGTRDRITLKQLRYMSREGFAIGQPGSIDPGRVSIFSFSLASDATIVDDAFLDSLRGYDAIVLSGGATANFILEKSGFDYIANGPQLQPLLSSGTVTGGLFDGKTVVLKGGFIGYENTYKTILEWLKQK